jgi:hypothetical protein
MSDYTRIMSSINRRELLQLTATLPLAAASATATAAEAATSAARSTGAFDELPVGAVRPEGWLRTQLRKQVDGVTSHLQHLYAPFTSKAWLADEPDPKGSWWPWEVRGYWCDGTLRCGLLLDNQTLIDEASRLIKYTFSNPASDGYLGPTALRAAGDANRWPHAVFFRAAMAWHDSTGDKTIVEGLRRHYLESKFNYIADRATTNVEAMLWTYERTGDERLLTLAEDSWARSQKFLAMSEGSFGLTEQSWLSPGPCGEVHGVTYAELTKIPALLYRATREQRYLSAAIGAQRKIFEHHLLPGGVPSTSEILSTTTARDAHEVCNAIDYPWTWGYLLGATGDGMYGDRIERVTFNGLPGSIRKDFKALQYYSSPNQFICTGHSDHVSSMKGTPLATIKEWRYLQRMSYRPSPGHSVVCCPGNLSRALPNYISRMWMADRRGKGLAATLYGPSRVTHRVGATPTEVEVHADTAYPYADSILFRLKTQREVEFPLHLRVPGWCKAPRISINDADIPLPQIRDGFVTLRRVWRSGDSVRLQLPMTMTTSKWPQDGIAIERGPLVYAYPIEQQWTKVDDERSSPEFPAWDLTPTGAWNYALLPESDQNKPVFQQQSMTGDPWSEPPASITVNARRVRDWQLVTTRVNDEDATMTPRLPDPALLTNSVTGASQPLKLVPYASTELRVTVFPRLKVEPLSS